jgi:hypothetical protein
MYYFLMPFSLSNSNHMHDLFHFFGRLGSKFKLFVKIYARYVRAQDIVQK